MPQLKNFALSPNTILPKIELTIENVYSNYNTASQDVVSYGSVFSDVKSCTSLTSEAESDGADCVPQKPRKRQRLDHLSQEEKIMRRKMKNRVAAQTARDRKKARMVELEEQVLELETERKMLLLANMNLRTQNDALQKENEELKLRLSETDITSEVKEQVPVTQLKTVTDVESRLTDSSGSLDHASFINVPLQKGQDLQLLSLWMMHFAYLPLIVRLMLFLIYCNSILKICSSLKISAHLFQNLPVSETPESVKCLPLKWWGPHQKAWNPTKN